MPYALKKRSDAIDYLDNHPLTITEPQALETNKLVHASQVKSTIKRYNAFNPTIKFDLLPTGVQTTVMSICFQYGSNAAVLDEMWEPLVCSEWHELIKYFDSFSTISGYKYKTRRNHEKNYLVEHLYE